MRIQGRINAKQIEVLRETAEKADLQIVAFGKKYINLNTKDPTQTKSTMSNDLKTQITITLRLNSDVTVQQQSNQNACTRERQQLVRNYKERKQNFYETVRPRDLITN